MTLGVDSVDLVRLFEVVMLVVVGVVFVLVVLLPLVAMIVKVTPQIIARATAPHESPPPPPGVPGLLALAAPELALGTPRALPAPEVASASGVPTIGEDLGATIDIVKVDGKVKASALRNVSEIVENYPNEAVSILRNWMYQEQ